MELLELILKTLEVGDGHPFRDRFAEIIESYKIHGTLTDSEVHEIESNVTCGLLISATLRHMTS